MGGKNSQEFKKKKKQDSKKKKKNAINSVEIEVHTYVARCFLQG